MVKSKKKTKNLKVDTSQTKESIVKEVVDTPSTIGEEMEDHQEEIMETVQVPEQVPEPTEPKEEDSIEATVEDPVADLRSDNPNLMDMSVSMDEKADDELKPIELENRDLSFDPVKNFRITGKASKREVTMEEVVEEEEQIDDDVLRLRLNMSKDAVEDRKAMNFDNLIANQAYACCGVLPFSS